MDLNVKTPFFLTQALIGALRAAATKEKPAKVINVASIDGIGSIRRKPIPMRASKAGLVHLTRRMALRLIEDNIVVRRHRARRVRSDMNIAARDNPEELAKRIPARRIGDPTRTWRAPRSTWLRAPAIMSWVQPWWWTAG